MKVRLSVVNHTTGKIYSEVLPENVANHFISQAASPSPHHLTIKVETVSSILPLLRPKEAVGV